MKLKWVVIVALILIGASIFVFYPGKNTDIPLNLIGKWTTSAPRYQDRFFEITKETLIYGLGGGKIDVYFISSMEESLEGNNILYTINYKNTDGLKFTQSFYYHPENGGSIQLKHQEHIKWTKEKDDAVAENFKTDQKQESRAK
ncbi:MAG: hypothetical protein WBG61_08460 [Desulfobacterales bacterium]|nr:hypothetical protein [Desulfobacterales bacterium]